MKSLNRCEFIGNVGNDIELRYMPSGDAVVNISLACGDSYKDKQGVKQERTEWVKLVAFSKLAETCAKFLSKGSRIYASGRMQTRSYDKDGVKVYSTEIVMNELLMLDSRAESASTSARGEAARPRDAGRGADIPAQIQGGIDDFQDDIPFGRFMDGEL